MIGFKEHAPPPAPTSIGIYEKETGQQKNTCTLEMRVYRPGYIIEGILLSKEIRKRGPGKLAKLQELMENEFGRKLDDYLKPLREMDSRLAKDGLSLLPRLGCRRAEWEVRTLLEHTIVDQNGTVTNMGKKVLEACKPALDPFLEFERLCLLKGIAERMEGLTEIRKLVGNSATATIFDFTKTSKPTSHEVELIKPVIDDFYLVNLEDTAALYSFPSTNSVVFVSNLSISEYYRFHYSLRKAIYTTYMQQKGKSVEPVKAHRFAGRIGTIDLLRNLGAYKLEEGYRFLRFPTSLLRTLARYSLSRLKRTSFASFLSTLKDDFRIIIDPEDLKRIYPFRVASDQVEAFFDSNFSMFLDRLFHAGIVDIKPDGEVILVE